MALLMHVLETYKFAMIAENGHNGLTCENGKGYRDAFAYPCLLKTELLGAKIADVKCHGHDRMESVPLKESNLFHYTLSINNGRNDKRQQEKCRSQHGKIISLQLT
jgi:hypothetical protein